MASRCPSLSGSVASGGVQQRPDERVLKPGQRLEKALGRAEFICRKSVNQTMQSLLGLGCYFDLSVNNDDRRAS